MPLKCLDSERSRTYNLLQAAHVGPVGTDLAKELKMNENDTALFGIFAESSEEAPDQPGRHSALCVFTLNKMNSKIRSGLQKCFNRERDISQGLRQFSDDIDCYYAPVRSCSNV